MTSRSGHRVLLTLGLLTVFAVEGRPQDAEPGMFPPPPPVAPFVPPPEGVAPLSEPANPARPRLPAADILSLPPLVLPAVRPDLPPRPDISDAMRSSKGFFSPVEPGEARPSKSRIVQASDSIPLFGPPSTEPFPFDVDHGFITDMELLPFGLAVQAPAFLDQAAPIDVFRVRGDAFFDMLRPDRAEYFWNKQGYLNAATGTTDGRGPALRDWKVNAQTVAIYVEARLSEDVSIFTNVPFRFTDPTFNPDHSGLSDVSLGVKWAFVLEPTRAISFQLAGTAPTGNRERGMGSGNWSVQPGFLWQEVLTDRFTIFSEVNDTIPIHPRTNFAGNILQYGVGASILAADVGHVRVMPTVEGVGWTVLGGHESPELQAVNEPLVQDSYGKTIVNVDAGIRFTLGDSFTDRGYLAMSDLYIGYGRAVTGTRWYRDIYRIEYRLRF